MVGAKTRLIWGKVGAWFGYGWVTGHGWSMVGAWLGQARLGQGCDKVGARLGRMVGAQGMLEAGLEHVWGMIGVWIH